MAAIQMTHITQTFDQAYITDVAQATRQAVLQSGLQLKPGASIAITAGSRGVANIACIIKAIADAVKERGGVPFVIPAMGSHGGATAEGQQELLAGYGVTEAFVGAPIRSSMQVVELDSTGLPHRLYMDKHAAQADGVIVCNRVKVHTDFHGPVESGMLKMCVIGLGKHAQALEMHSYGVYGLRELVAPAARKVLATGKIVLGVGVAENAYDQTAQIRAALPPSIEQAEAELLVWSRAHMPALPLSDMDILIIDRMGKDISGVGLDTNIIGRMRIPGQPEPDSPRVGMIIVDDLTDASHGNALGMGLADFVTQQLRDKIDFSATYENVLTSSFVARGNLPIVCATPAEALRHALRSCGRQAVEAPRILRIRDTLHLSGIWCSPAALADLPHAHTGASRPLFTETGALSPW